LFNLTGGQKTISQVNKKYRRQQKKLNDKETKLRLLACVLVAKPPVHHINKMD